MQFATHGDTCGEPAAGLLTAHDEVVFVTEHTTYRFVVEDPSEGRGLLRGGRLPAGRPAVFCGVFDRPHSFRPATILAGARALFFVEEGPDRSCYRRILTSRVLDVRVVKSEG